MVMTAGVRAALNALGASSRRLEKENSERPLSPGDATSAQHQDLTRQQAALSALQKFKDINLKRTIHDLERWPDTVKGYRAIASYAVFFLLFTFVVSEQLDVPKAYAVDNLVRNKFLDYDGALADVQTHGDFFDYLLSILGQMLPSTYYNGDGIPESEKGLASVPVERSRVKTRSQTCSDIATDTCPSSHKHTRTCTLTWTCIHRFLFDYNKLIGGVLVTQVLSLSPSLLHAHTHTGTHAIHTQQQDTYVTYLSHVQVRGKTKPCGEGIGNSSYNMFYPDCYTHDHVVRVCVSVRARSLTFTHTHTHTHTRSSSRAHARTHAHTHTQTTNTFL